MGSARVAFEAAARWEIVTPSQPCRHRGVRIAGFRDRTDEPLDLPVVPFPAVTVVVDLGEQLLVDDGSGHRRCGDAVIRLAPSGVRAQGRDVECLQMRLSPVVSHALFGTLLDSDDAVIRLEDVWGRDAARIRDQLRTATSWDDRFAIAEAALVREHHERWRVDPEVDHAWGEIVATGGQLRVEHLADELGWSRKRLWSRFRAQLGLSPKRAAQLVRFDRAAHRLAAGERPSLVAAEAGYVDQSHLHRDAMAFTGTTPRAVAHAPWLAVDDIAWPAAPASGHRSLP
jgi:AraC-like DNA-binding protein